MRALVICALATVLLGCSCPVPLQSDINLFPQTRSEVKAQIGRRLHLPLAGLIPDRALGLLGHWVQKPGRLYSFVAERRVDG